MKIICFLFVKSIIFIFCFRTLIFCYAQIWSIDGWKSSSHLKSSIPLWHKHTHTISLSLSLSYCLPTFSLSLFNLSILLYHSHSLTRTNSLSFCLKIKNNFTGDVLPVFNFLLEWIVFEATLSWHFLIF